MTDESGSTGIDTEVDVLKEDSATAPVISRRMLLRGATAAVPTILTLQSGAALAASSNLIGTVQYARQALGPDGNVQCLDMRGLGGTPTKLDLGRQVRQGMVVADRNSRSN